MEAPEVFLARIEERLISIHEKLDDTKQQNIKRDERVSALEHWKSRMKGAAIVIGVIWVVVVAAIEFFAHK